MTYTATTVAEGIELINKSHFLPPIQRPFVWTPEQITSLFDSLMKRYPISSFLFWQVAPENKRNWVIYRFMENFRFGELHNDTAEIDGRDVTLVLDGQQRLTSLLIGLRGSFTSKLKHKRWEDPSAWQREKLYLDLLLDPAKQELPEDSEEDDAEASYGFSFFGKPPLSGSGKLWMRVGEILESSTLERHAALKERLLADVKDGEQREIAIKNLDLLRSAVWEEKVICYYTETSQDADRALRIFIRANAAGQALSKSDLLLSMVASKWSDISARDEIFSFVDSVNSRLERPNKMDKDFVMRSCLLLSDLDHVYKIKNFTAHNLEIMRRNWPNIKAAIRNTFIMVNRFGIDRDNITTLNALHPIAYYLYRAKAGGLDGSTPFDMMNRERIRRWFFAVSLNAVFGGNSDNTMGAARRAIYNGMLESREFPIIDLYDALAKNRKRSVRFDETTVGRVLLTRYGNKAVFFILSLLYEEKSWGLVPHHIDHIIPQASASRKTLLGLNIPVSRIDMIVEASNSIGNLQLLTADENLAKSDGSFNSWIATRDSDFLKRHLIPEDPDLWDVRMLPEFVNAREKLIRRKLLSVAGDVMETL